MDEDELDERDEDKEQGEGVVQGEGAEKVQESDAEGYVLCRPGRRSTRCTDDRSHESIAAMPAPWT